MVEGDLSFEYIPANGSCTWILSGSHAWMELELRAEAVPASLEPDQRAEGPEPDSEAAASQEADYDYRSAGEVEAEAWRLCSQVSWT